MSSRYRLLLDVGLFAALVVAYAPSMTGLSVHEWLSLAILVPFLLHMVLNWDWVIRVAKGAMVRLRATTIVNAVVDLALFVSAVTVVLSGLLVSQVVMGTFGLEISVSGLWSTVHSVSADTTVALLLLHFVLHAQWMARVFQSLIDRIDPTDSSSLSSEPGIGRS